MTRRQPNGATALVDRPTSPGQSDGSRPDEDTTGGPTGSGPVRWWRRWWTGRRRVVSLAVVAVAAVGLAVGCWWLLWVSSAFTTRTVSVQGTSAQRAQQVSRAAAVRTGGPLMAVDTRVIGGRVLEVPGVAGVRVTRRLPHTLVVVVTERVPVAVLRSTGGQLRLVDADGTVWLPPGAVPASLPVLLDRDGTLDAATVDAAVQVSISLPTELRTRVRALVGTSPGTVLLVLGGGRVVVWGDPADTGAKARVATALLGGTKADYVDVSTPTAPVTRLRVPSGLVPAG